MNIYKQSLKSGGFTPTEAAASIAVDALMYVLRNPDSELENETPQYRRATLRAIYKLTDHLMAKHKLDGVIPDWEERREKAAL